jgi:hypothetical protein
MQNPRACHAFLKSEDASRLDDDEVRAALEALKEGGKTTITHYRKIKEKSMGEEAKLLQILREKQAQVRELEEANTNLKAKMEALEQGMRSRLFLLRVPDNSRSHPKPAPSCTCTADPVNQ